MIKSWCIIWVLPFLLIISCSSQNRVKDSSGDKGVIAKQEEPSPPSPFILGSGDEITFNVWRNEDLKRTVKIDPSGNIHLPLAGEIMASGLTIPQLREEVTLRLSKYIINPQVDINVSTLRSKKFHIFGEVRSPGTFTLDQKILVWEGISKAGGFTNDASEKSVLLVRSEKGVVKVIASAVLLEPVPAITETLPATISTVSSTTRSCSSKDIVADSPVVPQGTIADVPFSI